MIPSSSLSRGRASRAVAAVRSAYVPTRWAAKATLLGGRCRYGCCYCYCCCCCYCYCYYYYYYHHHRHYYYYYYCRPFSSSSSPTASAALAATRSCEERSTGVNDTGVREETLGLAFRSSNWST